MPKAFDPQKSVNQARASVKAAEEALAVQQGKVEAADKRIAAAKQKQVDAAAAKQKAVDTATVSRAALESKIEDLKAQIERGVAYVQSVENLAAPQTVAPEGVESDAEFGQVGGE